MVLPALLHLNFVEHAFWGKITGPFECVMYATFTDFFITLPIKNQRILSVLERNPNG